MERSQGIKYYSVGEYGSITQRPHYHSILFNVKDFDNVAKAWKQQGIIDIQPATAGAIAYVTKYVNKQTKFHDKDDPRLPEFSLMSKGLGANFITPSMSRYMKEHLNPYITHRGGDKIALPRYYKEKIFTEAEKQIINQKSKEHYETDGIKFDSFKHETEYIADHFRKRDKVARAKRYKI